MKNYIDWYSGQLVTAADLDAGTVDGPEDTEHAMNIDNGLAQALVADTPDPTVFGGILRGLVVSGVGNDYVSITAGACRDQLGKTIGLTAAPSTVLLTRTGLTTVGDASMATNATGADITLSCPTGDYIVASLYLVYDQELTNPVQNEAGTWVYKNVSESFKFDVQIGAAFDAVTGPVSLPNTFPSLTDGKVLLADILLENNLGSMEVKSIHMDSASWFNLGGFYVTFPGRRSDAFSAEIFDANIPLTALTGAIRGGTSREVFYSFLQKLQSYIPQATLSGPGAAMVGAEPQSEAVGLNIADTITLTAQSVSGQLAEIAGKLSSGLYRGGNNVLTPQANYNGIVADPTTMRADDVLFGIKALQTAGSSNHFRLGKLRGHLCIPDVFYENWLGYDSTWSGGRTVALFTNTTWTDFAGGTGNVHLRNSSDGAPNTGGVLELTWPNDVGNPINVYGMYNAAGTRITGGWALDAAPWVVYQTRIQVPDRTSLTVEVGLRNVSNHTIAFTMDNAANGNYNFWLHTTVAGPTVDSSDTVVECQDDTWYTLRFAVIADKSVVFQIDNGSEWPHTMTASFSSGPFAPYMHCRNAGAGDRALYVDEVVVSSGQLPSNKI